MQIYLNTYKGGWMSKMPTTRMGRQKTDYIKDTENRSHVFKFIHFLRTEIVVIKIIFFCIIIYNR